MVYVPRFSATRKNGTAKTDPRTASLEETLCFFDSSGTTASIGLSFQYLHNLYSATSAGGQLGDSALESTGFKCCVSSLNATHTLCREYWLSIYCARSNAACGRYQTR